MLHSNKIHKLESHTGLSHRPQSRGSFVDAPCKLQEHSSVLTHNFGMYNSYKIHGSMLSVSDFESICDRVYFPVLSYALQYAYRWSLIRSIPNFMDFVGALCKVQSTSNTHKKTGEWEGRTAMQQLYTIRKVHRKNDNRFICSHIHIRNQIIPKSYYSFL